jgi:hypothetical protein
MLTETSKNIQCIYMIIHTQSYRIWIYIYIYTYIPMNWSIIGETWSSCLVFLSCPCAHLDNDDDDEDYDDDDNDDKDNDDDNNDDDDDVYFDKLMENY